MQLWDRYMITLYKHQQRFIDTASDRYGIWHACGTGKTITGLSIANEGVETVLIICPKGVKSKWAVEADKILKCSFIIVTKEEFRRDWEKMAAYEMIIIDEAHHFSSIKSQLYKALMKYIKKHQVKYIYPMTATPYRREPMNIYALATIMGHKWNYIDFRNKFYRLVFFGPRAVWVPKKGIETDIAKLVRIIGDVVSFSECGDMPQVTYKVEKVEMTLAQKRDMKELEQTEANPLVFYGKEHQICSGICSGASDMKTRKNDRIEELAECNDKLAIFCRYTAQIKDLRIKLEKLGYIVFVIDGSTKDKEETAQKAEKSKKAILIIQAESAEGWETPSFDVIVFASLSYSYLAYEQSLGRFIRINKINNPKLFIYLITEDSIDEAVYKNLMAKQDFSLEIYSKSNKK